jgi:hypothetical protein
MHGYEYASRLFCGDVPSPPITEGITRGVTAECARFIYEDGSKSEIFKIPTNNTEIVDGANLTGGSGEMIGIKEVDGKLSYEEIDFEFIDLMAANMSKNKDKYPPFNWHKPISKMKLVDAILRHTRKVKQPIEGDIETAEEHLVSIACDAMMLFYQYKHYK